VPGISVAVVADHDPGKKSHRATDAALQHAAAALAAPLTVRWIATEAVPSGDAAGLLTPFDAVFLGPGAPYRNGDGAFAAVRFAREQGWPFFGT
jgi:CTP synthase (UTP-ammonia lyase)